jgi:hypothetical protein
MSAEELGFSPTGNWAEIYSDNPSSAGTVAASAPQQGSSRTPETPIQLRYYNEGYYHSDGE